MFRHHALDPSEFPRDEASLAGALIWIEVGLGQHLLSLYVNARWPSALVAEEEEQIWSRPLYRW